MIFFQGQLWFFYTNTPSRILTLFFFVIHNLFYFHCCSILLFGNILFLQLQRSQSLVHHFQMLQIFFIFPMAPKRLTSVDNTSTPSSTSTTDTPILPLMPKLLQSLLFLKLFVLMFLATYNHYIRNFLIKLKLSTSMLTTPFCLLILNGGRILILPWL